VIDAYRKATSNLRRTGYASVGVPTSRDTRPSNSTPRINQRTDKYGHRRRPVLERPQAARDGAGAQMIVGLRFNCDEMLPGGYNLVQAGS